MYIPVWIVVHSHLTSRKDYPPVCFSKPYVGSDDGGTKLRGVPTLRLGAPFCTTIDSELRNQPVEKEQTANATEQKALLRSHQPGS
jgi:hypothetical protein